MNPMRALALALALLATGCMQSPQQPPSGSAPSPEAVLRPGYERLQAQGQPVFQVDSARSLVTIFVRRGGSLARLGHDHLVASHSVQGWVAPGAGRADLFVPLAELSVDEAALRAQFDFDSQPSEADIAGTRANMQDKVLEVARFPYALIHVADLDRTATGVSLDLSITLRGVTRSLTVPATLASTPDALRISGSFEFDQSAFDIAPFSILNGAIKVEDRLRLHFDIDARRGMAPAAAPG